MSKFFLKNLVFFVALLPIVVMGQTTRTSTTGGSLWFDGGSGWSAGVPDAADNVTFNNSATATIQNGESASILNFTTNNNAILTIDAGGTFTVNGDFTTNNGTVINVDGTLIVTGDLVVNNNLVWNITGSVIINGNVTLNNGASLTVANTGSMDVDGNFTGGNNTALDIDGSINIDGDLSVGSGSTITGSGEVGVGGTCSDSGSTFCGTGPLPVSLVSFVANLSDGFVLLTWTTASQLNFSHFEVEHSINAEEWTMLAIAQGEGTTTELKEYSYTHNLPHNGKNYYRLKMVDLDETFEYSPIGAVVVNAGMSFIVSPNPTKGQAIRYHLNFDPTTGDIITIFDLTGAQLYSETALSSSEEIRLPSSLQKGTYIVQYKGASAIKTIRLVVD